MYFLNTAIIVNVADNIIEVIMTVRLNAAHMYKTAILSGKFMKKPIDVSIIDSFHADLLVKYLIITQQLK